MSYITKQVIVMRTDLGMRKGKMIAQGAHASMAFLTRQIENVDLSEAEQKWLKSSFAKICVRVDSEEELDQIHEKAKEKGLVVHEIIDSGKTEFKGLSTKTCLAIGPDYSEKIDEITGDLELL